ncbi:peptide ABC transporter substrate-binding protein [Anaerospora sp.]|uniref:peptide ABC transporter substrate-binding protein n=1 Tax=Anaerospora sp. TaxID=1960278 RepID=UPI002898F3DD|nr:peptide ABC transporter substrate-binding protein [Anaerospora sp.]
MPWKKYCVFALVALLTTSLLAGCGTASNTGKSEKILRYGAGAEPRTLDPRKSTGTPDSTIQAQLFEGLTALDQKENVVPAVAQSWDVSADGLTYTFHLRANAKWSNGESVTAHDFIYSWTTALSSDLASEYAYQLYYIKNGEAFNKGQAKATDLGLKALDDRTLEVTLEDPTAYFLTLLAFHTYYPVHKKTVEANPKWAADAKTIIGNGPFAITTWIHNSKIEFVKNAHYWDADKVKLSKLEFFLTDSSTTELAMFDNGQLDMGDNPPSTEFSRLKKENKLVITPYLGTYFYSFNVTAPPFDNSKVRKAFSLAVNREAIIQNITKGEQKAALSWVPFGVPDLDGTDFRQNGGNYLRDNNIETAKQLLAEAGYPSGQGLPQITLIYNTNEMHKAIAEALQEMWKKNLGVTVEIANQEWKVFIENRHKGFYQLARNGWLGDYADPMTFIDIFMSNSGNNEAQYKNPAYDKLVDLAKSTPDLSVRQKALHDAEKLLFDDAVLLPLYFYTKPAAVNPKVKGYSRSVLGTLYFKEAYIE